MAETFKVKNVYVGERAPAHKKIEPVLWVDTTPIKDGDPPVMKVYKNNTWILVVGG